MTFSLQEEAEKVMLNARLHYFDSWSDEDCEYWRGVEYSMVYVLHKDKIPDLQSGALLNDFQQGWNSGLVELRENIRKNWFL